VTPVLDGKIFIFVLMTPVLEWHLTGVLVRMKMSHELHQNDVGDESDALICNFACKIQKWDCSTPKG
jgi:hypothetical protein